MPVGTVLQREGVVSSRFGVMGKCRQCGYYQDLCSCDRPQPFTVIWKGKKFRVHAMSQEEAERHVQSNYGKATWWPEEATNA